MTEHNVKVAILGSGPAGCSAAIYTARAQLSPMMFHGHAPGGQLTTTMEVENYPGFAEPILGPQLMIQMLEHAKREGARIVESKIVQVDFSQRPFKLYDEQHRLYYAETVIIATGAEAKWLELDSEAYFKGYGVSACATCDGPLPIFRNKHLLVVGGGNTAVEEALFLSRFTEQVTLIHRGGSLRAEKVLQQRLFSNPRVKILWHQRLLEVLGTTNPKAVTGARLLDLNTNKTEDLDLAGIFIAIGHQPRTELFKDHLDMDETGYIITAPDSTVTNIPGVFAAGDVQDKVFRQAVTAAGTGCMAALEVEKFLDLQSMIE